MAVTQDPDAWARLGRKIREAREAQGASRRAFASRVGVSEKSIQVAEEGRTPRARWPQSLTLIEGGLGWTKGSMLHVLDGGEPTLLHGQTAAAAAAAADQRMPGRVNRSEGVPGDSLIPQEILEAFPVVSFFGKNCVAHGAPEWMGVAFENAVSGLMRAVKDHYEQPSLFDILEEDGTSPLPTELRVGYPMRSLRLESLLRVADRQTAEMPEDHERRTLVAIVNAARAALAEYTKRPTARTHQAMQNAHDTLLISLSRESRARS
ncbi:helix-turn-helix domain-containing protein [Streptomyces microflavus]|uniref:helix-turn-helix domain-containing protein n=1 Tax=Streptomyces microflavus TaxID=1919 RepID=UPI0033EBCA65